MYLAAAKKKCAKSVGRLFFEGILAGLLIAVGGYGSQLIAAAGLPKVVSAAVFPVGLIMVVLTGSELFTGNCLLAGPAWTGQISWADLGKVWGVSYLGNLVGSLLMAGGVSVIGMSDAYTQTAQAAAAAKVAMGVPEMLVRAFLCNLLVCVAVWTAINAAETAGKAIAAFVPVFAFVLLGFEHSVANMYFLAVGGADIGQSVFQIAVVTVGNILGGAAIGILLETRK